MEGNYQKELKEYEVQLDVKKWMYKIISYWWLFLLSLSFFIVLTYLYLRYVEYEYETVGSLLIKTAQATGLSEEKILLQESGLFGSGKMMTNEIEILKSKSLMLEVVKRLGIHVQYFDIGRVKEGELYKRSPIVLDTYDLVDKKDQFSFYLKILDDQKFRVSIKEDLEGEIQTFGIPFFNNKGKFIISKSNSFSTAKDYGSINYRIRINNPSRIATRYKNRVKVDHVGEKWTSTVLEVKLIDPVPKKAVDIINTLFEVYNDAEIKDKNTVLRNTLDFIDKRIAILENELKLVEGGIENLKKDYEIVSQQATGNTQLILEELNRLKQNLTDLEINRSLIQSLEDLFIENEQQLMLIPSNLVTNNQTLLDLVNSYNNIWFKKDKLIQSGATDQNPAVIAFERDLISFRSSILQTIKTLKDELDIPIRATSQRIEQLQENVKSIPTQERYLLDQKRQQAIIEGLYLFLLQKREETALSEAVATPNTRIIDLAESKNSPVFPQSRLFYLGALFIGFAFPFSVIFLRELLNDKIESESQIKKLVSIPVLGRIGLSKKEESLVVKPGSRSSISEMFRALRTNFSYLSPGKESKVMLVTSSQGGEGKTFVTLNLGMTMALSDKKVIVVGLDLRKPKLYKYMGIDSNDIGVSSYLVEKVGINEIVRQSEFHPNLFYITSGPIPPNPAELILTNKMNELIKKLKDNFDYVLFDTPPVGLVTDALLISNQMDNNLIIVRYKYSKIGMMEMLESFYKEGKFNNPGIVFNGVRSGRGYNYGYGGYSYGYGYGYYEKD